MNPDSPIAKVADHVIAVTHTKYSKRLDVLKHEFSRLGIDSVDVVTQYTNPFDVQFMHRVPHAVGMEHPVKANIWFGHYRALKIGYELGYERIMVVEDDVRFLSDTGKIREMVSEVPDSFYCLHLDPATDDIQQYRRGKNVASGAGLRHWGIMDGFSGRWLHAAGCYIMSRQCMESFIWLYESSIDERIPSRMLRAPDMWFTDLVNKSDSSMLYAVPNIAIQNFYRNDDSQNGFSASGVQETYRKMNIDVNNYERYD